LGKGKKKRKRQEVFKQNSNLRHNKTATEKGPIKRATEKGPVKHSGEKKSMGKAEVVFGRIEK